MSCKGASTSKFNLPGKLCMSDQAILLMCFCVCSEFTSLTAVSQLFLQDMIFFLVQFPDGPVQSAGICNLKPVTNIPLFLFPCLAMIAREKMRGTRSLSFSVNVVSVLGLMHVFLCTHRKGSEKASMPHVGSP